MVGHCVGFEMENTLDLNVKHDGGLVMIWGYIKTCGPGAWYKIESKMDRHLYKKKIKYIYMVHYTKL